jgi:hypothetical protein
MWAPPFVERPPFLTPTQTPPYSPRSTTPSSRTQKGLGDERVTACPAAPALENHLPPDGHTETFSGSLLGLTITSTPQGRFVYWKGFEPFELLNYESHLVAFTQELLFQEGRPLSPITEEGESSTELLEYSLRANHSPDRQVCMVSLCNAEDDELDPQYGNKQLADISADEPTGDAPQDEDEEHRRIRQVNNTTCPRTKESQQRFCSSRGSRVPYVDWRHRRSSTPISTTPIQSSNTKAAVLDPARARATRRATSSIFHSESTLEF